MWHIVEFDKKHKKVKHQNTHLRGLITPDLGNQEMGRGLGVLGHDRFLLGVKTQSFEKGLRLVQ